MRNNKILKISSDKYYIYDKNNIYNEESGEAQVNKQIYQSSVDRGVSDVNDEREHANGTRDR